LELTQDLLKKIVDYNEVTGELTWKERHASDFPFLEEKAEWLCKRFNSRFIGKPAFSEPSGKGYTRARLFGKYYLSHRIIWFYKTGEWPEEIDHINHDKVDNRWMNLRNVSHADNLKNKPRQRNNTSGHTGVHLCLDTNKYRAKIAIDGKKKCLGRFSTLEKAAAAYEEARMKYGYHPNHAK
jgi:hypothetical protein